ncbi:MAG: hypothetical protein ABIJ97_18280 [Bacteroidota bacterium]
MKKPLISTEEMCRQNIIGVKVENQNRQFNQTIGGSINKTIKRTRYLKLCWMCGSPYESFKYNSYACSPRCAQNIIYAMKKGFSPPARMEQLTKEKNVKEITNNYVF